MIDSRRMYETMKRLVAVPGISGTEGEVQTAYKLRELLMDIPYFQKHPENVRLVPLKNDPFERFIVTAFLECCPESGKTVILTGHYDVVDVEEYGNLKDAAFDLDAINDRIGELNMDEDCRKDLESGDWIFGRGTADMKFGHALCLELLRYYAENGGISGNLLYVAVCGEETNSEGMLRAVPFFREMEKEKGLEYQALLLAECYIVDDFTRPDTRYIHMGASGKIMPMFFFVGDATHGDMPFMGLDPNMMSAEVYRRLQMDPEFCQESNGEITPPPVCLKSQDLKSSYSVSTPLYSASYYNIISIDLDPEKVMGRLKRIAENSFDASIKLIAEKADGFEMRFGKRPALKQYASEVITYEELTEMARSRYEGDYDRYITGLVQGWQKEKLELQEIAVRTVKRVYELSGHNEPCIILSIIPPYYPDGYPDKKDPRVKKLLSALDGVMKYSEEKYHQPMAMRDYYMGLSDLSYTWMDADKNFDALFDNVVGVDQMYSLPIEDLKKFRVPGIVMGGYGKDFHKKTERLNRSYNFEELPCLYIRLINTLLN